MLSKLSARINLHSEASSHALIILLAYASDRFPRQRDTFSVSPFQQGFFLIRDLLDKLDHDYRQQAVEDVINVGYLPLAGRLVAALQSSDDSESPFPEIDPEPAFDHLATRIESLAKDQSLIEDYPKDIPRLLYIWKKARSSEPVTDYVESYLAGNPAQALILLQSYAPTVQSTSRDRIAPFPGDFEQPHYNRLEKVLQPELIFSALEKLEDFDPRSAEYERHAIRSGDDDLRRLAEQFSALHIQNSDSQTGSDGTE